MLRPEYIPLINTLIESTHNGILKWSKGESYRSYISQPTAEQKLLIDRYYSRSEGQTIPCINLTIFKENDEIIDEIVLCKPLDESDYYLLLENLYKEVEIRFNMKESNEIPPVLTHITESLQQKILGQEHH